MIKLFRNSQPIHIFWLAVITFALRISPFAKLTTYNQQPFSSLLQHLLIPINNQYYISYHNSLIIACIIVFIQAMLLNFITNKYVILGKLTYLPALFYIIYCSILSPFLTLSPALVANFFVLYIFYKLLSGYKKPDAISTFFDIGLVIGLGTILYFPFLVLLVWIWVSLIILRPFYWREWLSPFIAFLLIQFFLAVFYYYNNSFNLMLKFWQPIRSPITLFIKFNAINYLVLLPLAVSLLLGILHLRLNFFKTIVLVRKTFIVLLLLTVVITFSFYLSPAFKLRHFILLATPAAILCGYYFLNARIKWIYETQFILIIIFIAYFQFTS